MSYQLLHGDVITTLRMLDDNSVDAIVTDPPYGLEFMGKEWDGGDGFQKSLSRESGDYQSIGAGRKSKPGIGERETEWPSHQGWNRTRCSKCGHLSHGGSPCTCDKTNFVAADNRWALFQEWCEAWATECLRVLKPGGHMLAFGGTRTYHRLAVAIEDAGFEIRDSLMWLYGSGFPKSMDVSKAIDKAAGAERTEKRAPQSGTRKLRRRDNMRALREGTMAQEGGFSRPWMSDPEAVERAHWDYAPATPEAEQWEGWGTALKPAYEPIVLARKPLIGTVAKNVLAHGTGALNIDASRIEYLSDADRDSAKPQGIATTKVAGAQAATPDAGRDLPRVQFEWTQKHGRWPANVLFDDEAAAILDEQTGTLISRAGKPRGSAEPGNGWGMTKTGAEYNDAGGASRFFYCAKASKSERNAGLDSMQEIESKRTMSGGADTRGRPTPANKNTHPTVKPVALMRYLVKLVTPPDGVVLDPFVGSGTTGIACEREGFSFIGIDQSAEYLDIARQRIEAA